MILFERFSKLAFLLLLPQIRARRELFLLDLSLIDGKPTDIAGPQRWARYFVPGLRVYRWPQQRLHECFFAANAMRPQLVSRLAHRLQCSAGFRLLRRCYPAALMLKAMQKLAVEFSASTCLLRLAARTAVDAGRGPVMAAPCATDACGILERMDKITVPKRIAWLNGLRAIGDAVKSLLMLVYIAGFRMHRTCATAKGRAFDYANIIFWGGVGTVQDLRHTESDYRERRNRWNSFYLEDGQAFRPQNLLYCFLNWRFSASTEAQMRRYISDRGGHYCYIDDLDPTWRHLLCRQLLNYGIGSLPWLLAGLAGGPAQWLLMVHAIRVLHHANKWEIFCLHYRPRVMMGYDDQSVSHIARTAVFHRYGLKTAGIHHPAESGLYLSPELAFCAFDLHFEYSQTERREFAPFWDAFRHRIVGPLRCDLIHSAMGNAATREAFGNKYGAGCKSILVAPPGPGLINDPQRVNQFYRGLLRVLAERRDVRLILRPRATFHLPAAQLQPWIDSGRLSIEVDDFDTYELMACCDLVVTVASSMVQEALASRRPVVCFTTNRLDALYPFYKMNPLLVATSEDELVARIHRFLDVPQTLANIDEIRQQVGPGADGGCVQRLRNALIELAREAPVQSDPRQGGLAN